MHASSIIIAPEQMPIINAHAFVLNKARGPKFSISLHLHPSIVYVSSDCSGECVYLQNCLGPMR